MGRDNDGGDGQRRLPLQAVVLCDSFTVNFRPFTLERPKVLLPLCGVPMIEYTLEWLESQGVEETFVFCCAHYEKVISQLKKKVDAQGQGRRGPPRAGQTRANETGADHLDQLHVGG
mmetsp:Transcript_12933/g.24481  ORF Transcript_12933/g.24481 Transcript_12933/m.24481 type:complete len:117 (+) Transcript_12933:73-423(+)